MSDPLAGITVLIVEDGDEYRDNLQHFVPGPRYLQAHNGAEAVAILSGEPVSLVYLDMRFDRIPRNELLGDHARATREHNGDPLRAWSFLVNNQGLFILDEMRRRGFGSLPVILAYDFSREPARLSNLLELYPTLTWVPDMVTPEEIRARIERLIKST
jgi:CheY-like chemotaxis protein